MPSFNTSVYISIFICINTHTHIYVFQYLHCTWSKRQTVSFACKTHVRCPLLHFVPFSPLLTTLVLSSTVVCRMPCLVFILLSSSFFLFKQMSPQHICPYHRMLILCAGRITGSHICICYIFPLQITCLREEYCLQLLMLSFAE